MSCLSICESIYPRNTGFYLTGWVSSDAVLARSIQPFVLAYLGSAYTASMVSPYISKNFTSQDYLIPYVQKKWQAGMPNCSI